MEMKTIVAYPAFKNRRTNPYQALLYEALQEHGWRIMDLDDALKCLVRPDVLHLHWPDGFALHRSLFKSLFRSLLLLLLLRIYRIMGARVVWTVHNLHSHEQFHPRLERWFWNRFIGLLDGWIALNRATVDRVANDPLLPKLPHTVIPHGLYPVDHDIQVKPSVAGDDDFRLLFFGKLRTYKEVPALVEAYAALPAGSGRLVIAGQCHESELAGLLEEKSQQLDGLEVRLGYLPESELTALLEQASGVVVPYAGSLNSGVLFKALSHGKPVLVPETAVFLEVAKDFPKGMIHCFQPPISKEDLSSFMKAVQDQSRVELDAIPEAYTWNSIAAEHHRFFSSLRVGKP